IHHPAEPPVERPLDRDFDAVAVAVQTAVRAGGRDMRGLELKGLDQLHAPRLPARPAAKSLCAPAIGSARRAGPRASTPPRPSARPRPTRAKAARLRSAHSA